MQKVAYLGPEKTNTHFAAQKKFGKRAQYLHMPTVEEVFESVERKKADFGVVPIENSLEGVVTHTLDRFIDFEESPATIHGEIELPIRHYFITKPGVSSDGVRVIYSHPQALAQCRSWLEKNYSDASLRETGSTAEAVEDLLPGPKSVWGPKERAAIGRLELARKHKLKAYPIPIDQENRTRFLVIGLEKAPKRKGKKNKTSLMFALKDKPGALYSVLTPFKNRNINMTKIESRPSKQKAWEYLFFVDIEGHQTDRKVSAALESIQKRSATFKVLGSYPRSIR